jgi:hypothetical protein
MLEHECLFVLKSKRRAPRAQRLHFIHRLQRQTDELRKRDKQLRCPDLLVLPA